MSASTRLELRSGREMEREGLSKDRVTDLFSQRLRLVVVHPHVEHEDVAAAHLAEARRARLVQHAESTAGREEGKHCDCTAQRMVASSGVSQREGSEKREARRVPTHRPEEM